MSIRIRKSLKPLFIIRRRANGIEGTHDADQLDATTMVSNLLANEGISTHTIKANNMLDVDSEVSAFDPTHVIVEGAWIRPSEFLELQNKHPDVTWIVRIEHELPLLANKENALRLIVDHMHIKNLYISFNSKRTSIEIIDFIIGGLGPYYSEKIIYLPDYYDFSYNEEASDTLKCSKIGCPCESDQCSLRTHWPGSGIHIGCFGDINLLNNHLLQASAAIKMGDILGKSIYFHIDSRSTDKEGESIIGNLRDLFKSVDHVLVEHGYMERKCFLSMVRRMDICTQVSFVNAFDIIIADLISQGIPVVTSGEVEFVGRLFRANPNKSIAVMTKMIFALFGSSMNLQNWNRLLLNSYNKKVRRVWMDFMVFHQL